MSTTGPYYEIIKHVIENAAELSKNKFGSVYDIGTAYRVHQMQVIPQVLRAARDSTQQVDQCVKICFHRQAEFSPMDGWFTIHKDIN